MDVRALYALAMEHAAAGSAQPADADPGPHAAAAGSAQPVEELDADPEAALGPPPEPHAGRHKGGRSNIKTRFRFTKICRSKWFRRLAVQSKIFNASGSARTRDHLLPEAPARARRLVAGRRTQGARALEPLPKIKGKGAWKRSTPEFICKTGFAPGHASLRTLCGNTGVSAAHARGCNLVVSNVIMEAQDAIMRERAAQSRRCKLDFYITNNMFDETKLFVGASNAGGSGSASLRPLASSRTSSVTAAPSTTRMSFARRSS